MLGVNYDYNYFITVLSLVFCKVLHLFIACYEIMTLFNRKKKAKGKLGTFHSNENW